MSSKSPRRLLASMRRSVHTDPASVAPTEVMPVIEGTAMGVNYGFDKLRFLSPVRAGSRVRGRFTLAEAKLRKPKELQSRTNVTVEIEGEDKPALVADWIGLIYFE